MRYIIRGHTPRRDAFLNLRRIRRRSNLWMFLTASRASCSLLTPNPVMPCSITSGTEPLRKAITGVPHAIASIITRPKGSGQSNRKKQCASAMELGSAIGVLRHQKSWRTHNEETYRGCRRQQPDVWRRRACGDADHGISARAERDRGGLVQAERLRS